MNRSHRRALVITLLSMSLLAGGAFAADGEGKSKIGKIHAGPTVVEWQPEVDHERLQLTVSTPWGEVWSKEFPAGKNPSFRIQDIPGRVVDGSYTWELRVVPKIHPQVRRELERLRAAGDETGVLRLRAEAGLADELVESGGFTIVNGTIASPDAVEEGGGESQERRALIAGEGEVSALTTISGDLTVYNSLCVGFDCLTQESYGADTIRLKENNVRIHFDDTSSTGSFPNRDWRIFVNDQPNGGLNRFSIEDATAARFPFTIEGNAAANAIYVDDGGRVGFGTAAPVVELHSTNGDTPTLRLDQNTSSGFAAQVWDVAGNETSFFVRDASNGSTLPFRIRPGAPSNSLVIAQGGAVGVGTLSPSDRLHVTGTASPKVLIQDTVDDANDKPGLLLRSPAANGGGDWAFEVDNAGNFQIDYTPSPGPEIVFSDSTGANSAVTINGSLTVVGTCTGCDRVFQPDFELESIEEHSSFMFTNSYLAAVGPTPEGKTGINVFEKTTGILQELEKAHIYIARLNEEKKTLRMEQAELRDEVAKLRDLVEAMLAERQP